MDSHQTLSVHGESVKYARWLRNVNKSRNIGCSLSTVNPFVCFDSYCNVLTGRQRTADKYAVCLHDLTEVHIKRLYRRQRASDVMRFFPKDMPDGQITAIQMSMTGQ